MSISSLLTNPSSIGLLIFCLKVRLCYRCLDHLQIIGSMLQEISTITRSFIIGLTRSLLTSMRAQAAAMASASAQRSSRPWVALAARATVVSIPSVPRSASMHCRHGPLISPVSLSRVSK